MAKLSKQHRRRWRRHLRTLLFTLLLLGALPGLVAAGASGQPQLLWLIPVGMAAAVLGAPFAVVALATMLLPLLAVAVAFGVPLFLAYRVVDGRQRAAASLPDEVILRRRYVAGELSYEAFRDAMLARLTERVTAGELSLTAYEDEVDRLLRPGRHLDAGRDPSLSGALRLR